VSRKSMISALVAAGLLALPGAASAATITGWNLGNVAEGPTDDDGTDDVGGASLVYDTIIKDDEGNIDPDAVASADTNGKIVYIAPESNTPGVKVVQESYAGDLFDGCIMASSTATCTSPFQSGKRIKQQVTDTGTIDLVFDVSTDPEGDAEAIYQVFHRLINVTGEQLDGFEVSLGTGVGADFSASTSGDGLRFATNDDGVGFGPDDLAAFSQYPFGLFGGEPLNPNPLKLPGFFDTKDRAGFTVSLGEDTITSTEYYGIYDDLFGGWLSQEDVPLGLLYDYQDGSDPLVMAWAGADGWEFLRCTETGLEGDPCLAPAGQTPDIGVGPLGSTIFAFDYDNNAQGISDSMFEYMAKNLVGADGGTQLTFGTAEDGADLFVDAIEDLANLNLTFAIALDDSFTGSSFTLRVNTYDTTPIPLPATAPLLVAGLGAFGWASRRRKSA